MTNWFDIILPKIDELGLAEKVAVEAAAGRPVFPSTDLLDILRAFSFRPPEETRVVILGQDPYPRPQHPTGMCFGIRKAEWENELPSSLANIKRELQADLGVELRDLSLTSWAAQGVLLMNTHLTTNYTPNAHAGWGWDKVTGAALAYLGELPHDKVFVGWGRKAIDQIQKHVPIDIGGPNFLVQSTHPCRRSASTHTSRLHSFIGSRPFSKVNTLLDDAIEWGRK